MSWQDLAREAAAVLGVDEKIVLATVEAETGGRNVLGDDGNAMGYGQVWVSEWHYPKLQKVASMLGLSPPPQSDIYGLQQFVLGNDRLSMYLAAETIKSFWQSAGGDWEAFTRGYVGPAIPSHDLERRRQIWERYVKFYSPSQGQQAAPGGVKMLPIDGQAVLVVGLSLGAVLALLGGEKKEG